MKCMQTVRMGDKAIDRMSHLDLDEGTIAICHEQLLLAVMHADNTEQQMPGRTKREGRHWMADKLAHFIHICPGVHRSRKALGPMCYAQTVGDGHTCPDIMYMVRARRRTFC
jgi:hypothetical protein